ncbi:MAG: hypothetical protein ACPGSM_03030 [Thiolinea sp.]
MYQTLKLMICTIPCLLLATGCNTVVSKKSPPISHIHVGHTLTGWAATPDKKGLITTAEQEAAIVMANSQKAKKAGSLTEKKKYMANALHALDPKAQKSGPGRGYGLTRAMIESIAHLQFAASSPDASANIKRTVPIIAGKAQKLSGAANQLKVFAQAAKGASSEPEADALIGEFMKTAAQLNGSYSIAAFKKDIQSMVQKERPAYQTVDSYYLFNLIRLPSGAWGFASGNKHDSHDDDGGSY